MTILQKYHAKIVADQKEKATGAANANGGVTEQHVVSPGKRGSSAVAARQSMTKDEVAELLRSPQVLGDSNIITPLGLGSPQHAAPANTQQSAGGSPDKGVNLKAITALVAKQQPYRYTGLRPPHMTVEELRKKDNVEEEYPLTYMELKSKVWHSDTLG